MSQRKLKSPAASTDETLTEEKYQKLFAESSSPIAQAILDVRRDYVERDEPFLSDEEIRYEVNLAKHGKQVADALRENETLRREVERLKQEVEVLKLEKDAA